MTAQTLVAAHLSSVVPSRAYVSTHPIQTSRRDLPLPTNQATQGFPEGHASHTSSFWSLHTGHILIRVIQHDLTVELVSASSSFSPIRFAFPSAVLPNPSLVLWIENELHLLVFTLSGSLFRVIIPIDDESSIWQAPLKRVWHTEWYSKKLNLGSVRLAYIQNPRSILLSLTNGSLIHLESDFSGGAHTSESWTETEYKTSNWYSSLIPSLSPSRSQPNEIVAIGSFPTPSDSEDIFTISRDRTLRRWSPLKGFRSEISLSHLVSPSSSSESPPVLLDAAPQKLMQILAPNDNTSELYVLVFLPTPGATTSGGSFYLLGIYGSSWELLGNACCSPTSVHCTLQDFVLKSGVLYTLWQQHGQAVLEMAEFSLESNTPLSWQQASYTSISDLSQTNIDELLAQSGSLADRFMQLLLRPGVFSPLTLQLAVQEYTDHFLSLPGPHPPALLAAYPTLSEHIASVVGSTVQLTQDPRTGRTQYPQYWSALRRDWEGFIARCREIERSARWPLALGFGSPEEDIVILERERIGTIVGEDIPLKLHRMLTLSTPLGPAHNLLETCWVVRTKMSSELMRGIENETFNILNQEFAYPLADIILEASGKVFCAGDLSEDLEAWIGSRLLSFQDVDQGIRNALDVIGGLDKIIKQEEDEVELMVPQSSSEWTNAFITSYISRTVEIRYEMCLSLVVLLFYLAEDLSQYDPMLITEVFAVFRGVVMLRLLCRQAAGDLLGSKTESLTSPEIEENGSRLSSLRAASECTYSLIHSLLSQVMCLGNLSTAAHHFLDQTGLLATITPAYATKAEVILCERLRLSGYREIAQQLIALLPRTPSVSYVAGRIKIDLGRADDSVSLLQSLSGSFGPHSSSSMTDRDALAAVLPSGRMCASEFDYYRHVASIYRSALLLTHEVHFYKLALQVAPVGLDTTDISISLVRGYIELSRYVEAYSTLISIQDLEWQRQLLVQLVYKICDDGAIESLTSMNFSGMSKAVEEALSFKVRNADPRQAPNYPQILYTWYVSRGDFRNAAMTMYMCSQKLSEARREPRDIDVLEQESEALAIAINALSLVDQASAWFSYPTLSRAIKEPRKRRKLNGYIPDYKFSSGLRSTDVVSLADMQQEHAYLSAELELVRRDPNLLTGGGLTPQGMVLKLVQLGTLDLAMHTAQALDVDMTEVFQSIAAKCTQLTEPNDPSLLDPASDWLFAESVSSWTRSLKDKGWRYLRQSLERFDTAGDFKYRKVVLDVLLLDGQPSSLPQWLVHDLEEHHPEYLIRAYLRSGYLQDALQYSLILVRKTTASTERVPSTRSSSTWLPYSLIDSVLKTVEQEPKISPDVQALSQLLRKELNSRLRNLKQLNDRARNFIR